MLKIIPLGGMGHVTQNMFVYEYEDEMLIVDCGIGFPDNYMPGVDVLIPDYRYVVKSLEQGKKIVGLIFSHGHDDHIAAAPYIMQHLPEFPMYGSPLTAKFAEKRLLDAGFDRPVTTVRDSQEIRLSQYFSFQLFGVTHSVPDTRHVLIHTPEGIMYHGSDFKLDPSPVDGKVSDLDGIKTATQDKTLCMMIDCLRIENPNWTPSESTVGPVLFEEMSKAQGKIVVTLMSSHIHRIQQVIDAAEQLGRRVAFIGRSVEQNVDVAVELQELRLPRAMRIDKREIDTIPDNQLCLIVAGSQGQEGSSFVRAVYGEHPILRISQTDTVIFSADAIPGNEVDYYAAIDELSRNKVHVVYPAVRPDIHRSGHASQPEQVALIEAIRPSYLLPIGGTDRHRFKFFELAARPLGYSPDRVLMPVEGEVVGFEGGQARSLEVLTLQPQIVDGLGIGDVGPIVLSDRLVLGQAGIVVIIVPRQGKRLLVEKMSVVSRGFIFMKEATEVIEFIKEAAATIIAKESKLKDDELERVIEKRIARKLYQIIKREPMIVAEIVSIG
jgi:ribonuclease J